MAVNSEILSALTSGINSEVAAYVFYIEAMKKVDNDELVPILENLAGEEKKHFQILERQYDSLVRSEMWISTADILKQEGLPEIDAEMAEKHRDLIDRINNLTSVSEILDLALKLELEAQELFKKLSAQSKAKEAKMTFDHLAGFEEGHAKLIRDMIEKFS
ncbi:MAG: ferritin family protein [Candidatus Zixiibacteriota bacterium]